MASDPDSLLPLSPAVLLILVSLAAEDLHGYGIMQEVTRQSNGKHKLGPGTLYDNLKKLLEDGLIDERPAAKAGDDPRRRYYRLNRFGRRVLQAELNRLDGLIRDAKLRLAESR
jgi:DNA-binding PadR family transcriptional regulator